MYGKNIWNYNITPLNNMIFVTKNWILWNLNFSRDLYTLSKNLKIIDDKQGDIDKLSYQYIWYQDILANIQELNFFNILIIKKN